MERPIIFADHGSDEFNCRLGDVLRRLAGDTEKGLGDNLVALILGGGYGRGEGGIVVIDGVEHPYNDLDLTFIVKDKGAIDWKVVEGISHKYEREIKIDVDFSRPLTIRDIENWSHTLMWYDLLNGHIILSGPDDILTTHAPETLQQPVPAIEATRLLLNRGAGLLWGERVLRKVEPPPDKDFVRRNYYKCALAMGDALLIVHKRFATPYRGRDGLLIRLSDDVKEVVALELTDLYIEALKFKFSPDAKIGVSFSIDDFQGLAKLWGEVFLHVERLRTGRPFELMTIMSNGVELENLCSTVRIN